MFSFVDYGGLPRPKPVVPGRDVCVGQIIQKEKDRLVFCPANQCGKCSVLNGRSCHYSAEMRLAPNVHYCNRGMIRRTEKPPEVICQRFWNGRCLASKQSVECLYGKDWKKLNPVAE
jgi:hypothetical protein